jgi:pyridoxal phosphate enzyme (YggS family)
MPEADLAHRLVTVRSRIAAACARAGRQPSDVRLVAVSKTYPSATIAAARGAGLADFGESRVQELVEKAEALPGEALGGAVRWHLIGPLQRNKAKFVAEVADVFHALDSVRLAKELEKRLAQQDRRLPCFVQVNVSGEASKSGVAPDDCHLFLDKLAAFERLEIVGLMAIAAPADSDEELERLVRPQFQQLRRLAETYGRLPLNRLSMGMSGDFEMAIEEGATDIRVGSALFGAR